MPDNFSKYASSLESPASGAFVITPNDNIDLQEVTRALYIGSTGDLNLIMLTGDEISFSALPSGFILPVRASRIKATGTTAADIIGLV